MKKINLEKIIKEVTKVELQLKRDNYSFTTKGLVHLVVNLIEEQLREN